MTNICENCAHRVVCKYREPCGKCNQFAKEIVRCKECKRYSQSGLCNLYLNISLEMKPDDFCSYGERGDVE